MRTLFSSPTPRRGFLGRVGAAALLGLTSWKPFALVAETTDQIDAKDKWLDDLKGKHRQFFDMPAPNGGLPLLHVRNWLNTWRDAYGTPDKELSAVGSLYGANTLVAFKDEMWAKYGFGKLINANDASGAPLTRNMFAHPKTGDPFAFGFLDASMEALQARGAVFLLCNNALGVWSGAIAKAAGKKPDEIRTELLAHLQPHVILVPGMVVAINKAQERGMSYMYLA